MEIKKIVAASDSFKGSLSSAEVAAAIKAGVHNVFPHCEVLELSVADGGEGTVDALVHTLGGTKVTVQVSDPLGRPIDASYGIIPASNDSSECPTAVIEMSSASGLPLLTPAERNPLKTSTRGTGEMILDALNRGCRHFLVGIGGSATNDAGIGMLSALGFRFLNSDGIEVPAVGASLGEIVSFDFSDVVPSVFESTFTVACDVDTPFCGPNGAAYVFAPQKGADDAMVRLLDSGMVSFADLISRSLTDGTLHNDNFHHTSKHIGNLADVPGTGAAGGLGGGFLAFLNAKLERGVDMVLDAIDFDTRISGADLVITGEGKIDFQTNKGKTPYGVMLRASRQGIPTIALGGSVDLPASFASPSSEVSSEVSSELSSEPSSELLSPNKVTEPTFAGVFPIVAGPVDLEVAMQHDVASANVCRTVTQIMNVIKYLK